MTVFKAFLKILSRNKWILILYTTILIFFSVFSVQSNENTMVFESTKPDIYITNHDEDQGITRSLINYLTERSNVISLPSEEDALSDAIFYRHVNFAIEIPAGFRTDFLAGKNPEITTQSSGDYNASLAEMTLTRFLETAGAYRLIDHDEQKLIQDIEKTLSTEVPVRLTTKLDASGLNRAAFYYNFLNYPLLVGCIFIICLILLSFRDPKIADRITIGALKPEKVNRILLGANCLFAAAMWLVYVLISFIVVGGAMFSIQGLLFILNSFVFTFLVVALALLIANLVKSRNALNGLVNVIGLGSSFLCGAFVPMQWLPDFVRTIAHVLPSYWYIEANNKISTLETLSWSTLQPIFFNILVVILFAATFIVLTNFITARRHQD